MFVNHVHLMPGWVMQDGTVDVLLPLLDAIGAEGAVCFAPFTTQVSERLASPNTWLYDSIKQRKGLVGYGTLDPAQPPEDQVKAIIDLGFPGVKLHPAFQRYEMLGPWAMRVYAALEKSDLIADFHVGVHGYRLSHNNPLDLDEVACRFPTLRMVYEHVGGWHFFRQVVAVIANDEGHGNRLYAGVASVLDRKESRGWYLGPEGLDDCRWQVGDRQMIYGLDFPYNQLPYVEKDLAIIRSLNWPTEAIQGLLGGNLKRLLRHAG